MHKFCTAVCSESCGLFCVPKMLLSKYKQLAYGAYKHQNSRLPLCELHHVIWSVHILSQLDTESVYLTKVRKCLGLGTSKYLKKYNLLRKSISNISD